MNPNLTPAPDSETRLPEGDVNRLVAAAVVNQKFRDLLLSEPARALASGFQGEEFDLDYHQEALILSIQASSLSEFARQLVDLQSTKQEPHLSSGSWVPTRCSSVVLDAE